jgi:hypothetical protein
MVEIKNANLNVTAAFIIKIGELQVTAEAQMWVYKDKDGTKTVDADFADITDITYMGIPIVGYESFNKFKKCESVISSRDVTIAFGSVLENT